MPGDVFVTGASGVIGAAIARHLAKAGYALHVTARDVSRLRSLQKELPTLQTYALDLKDTAQCETVIGDFFKAAPHPVGLICNAGNLGALGAFLDIDFKEWSAGLKVNFLSQAALIRAFGRRFRDQKRKDGRIIVLSGAGVGGPVRHPNLTSYGTAKAALTFLVEALAQELPDMEINAIAPGQVNSGLTEEAIRAGVERAGPYALTAEQCKKEGGVSPDLAAELVEFLLSSAAKGITGRLLSARFDQKVLRDSPQRVAADAHFFRLRRIDHDLFVPKNPKL